MSAAQFVFVGLVLTLIAGCIVREDRGGPDFDRGRSDFHGPDREHDSERGSDQDRNNYPRHQY